MPQCEGGEYMDATLRDCNNTKVQHCGRARMTDCENAKVREFESGRVTSDENAKVRELIMPNWQSAKV